MAELHEMISPAMEEEIASHGGGIVTGVAVAFEIVGDDGDLHLLTLYDDDLSTWRAIGLLQGALEDTRVAHTLWMRRGDE